MSPAEPGMRYKCEHDYGRWRDQPCDAGCNAPRLPTMELWRAANEEWKSVGWERVDRRLKPVYDPPDCSTCGKAVFDPALLPAFAPMPDVCVCPPPAPSDADALATLRAAVREVFAAWDDRFDFAQSDEWTQEGENVRGARYNEAMRTLRALAADSPPGTPGRPASGAHGVASDANAPCHPAPISSAAALQENP